MENIKQLTWTFESFVNKMENWIEFWFVRDLQHLFWYTKLDNFLNVISKAKTAIETTDEEIINHFADVGKKVKIGYWSWSER